MTHTPRAAGREPRIWRNNCKVVCGFSTVPGMGGVGAPDHPPPRAVQGSTV